jgi:hypothetical protein
MRIRFDSEGNIVTTAPDSESLSDSVQINSANVPTDFSKYGGYKYLYRDGAFVIKSGYVEPVVPANDTTDHAAIIAERLREQGVHPE